MRIGHYTPDLGAAGGMATYIRRLGGAQEQAGDTVFYLSRPAHAREQPSCVGVRDDDELFKKARELALDVLHLHSPVETLPADRVPTVRTMHGNQGSCPSGSRYLARSGQPCHRKYTVAGCLWGHLVDHCGSRRPHRLQADFQNIRLEQRLAAELPTFTVSRFLKEQMIRSGCPPENLRVLPSPAPDVSETFAPLPRSETPRFLFLGRITPKKGVGWLLRAVSHVEVPCRVDIAGDGSDQMMQKMHTLAGDLGIADRVTFHGWLDPKEVNSLIRKARAVVFPSVWHEPAGLVTLEAAAQGRPVIASRVGGIPEYADEAFARLVPPNEVGALADGIAALATDPDRAEQMGRAGRQIAGSRFAMEPFVEALNRQYEQVVEEQAVEAEWRGSAPVRPHA